MITSIIPTLASVFAAAALAVTPAGDTIQTISIPVHVSIVETQETYLVNWTTHTVHTAGCPLKGDTLAEMTGSLEYILTSGYTLCPVCQTGE